MKQFTIENLINDRACGSGMEFVTPIIEAGKSVPQALKDAGHVDWISWALKKGYDLEEIRSENFFWDASGIITAMAGDYGTAMAGKYGTAIAGYGGEAIAGYGGKATVGDYGKAIAGFYGTATAGYMGTAISGNEGLALVGNGGTVMAGDGGTIQSEYLDSNGKYRIATGYIGENGLKPNTPYKVDDNGNFYEVTDPVA